MTRSLDPDEPTPEFRAHLQWQLETALRRQTRLAAPIGGSSSHLRTVVLVVVALAAGGAAGVASGHVQDARQRESLVERVHSEEGLVRMRLELARAELQEVQSRFEVGAAGRESVLAAEAQVRALETALKRLRLDLEEIRGTSAAPRDDLDAPLIDQRDFVRDRLLLELEAAQRALAAAEQRVGQVRGRVEIGTAARAALLAAETERAQAEADMRLLRARLDLRERYLRRELRAEELASTVRRTELSVRLERAQREMALARDRVSALRRQLSVGLASELDVKRAEVDLLEREVELQRIRKELDLLGRRGGDR